MQQNTVNEELVDEVDVEEFVKAGRPVPRAKRYRIRINRDHFTVTVPEMTGREILALVGLTPEKATLSQKFRGGAAQPVGPDEVVSFVGAGVERFMTVPRDSTEG